MVINKIVQFRPVVVNVTVTDNGAVVKLCKACETTVFAVVGGRFFVGSYDKYLRKKPLHLYLINPFLS